MLDPSLARAVAAVVREGSFERAAVALHVTPSAVSQRVKLAEERLGVALVVRGQPCAATEAGARVCRHAELLGMLEAELRRELPGPAAAAAGAERPVLRIAVNADSLATWFVGALAAFAQGDEALVEVDVDDQDHTAGWLDRGRVLAAVTSFATPVRGCRSRRLGLLRYRATASPAYVQRWLADGVTAAALTRAPSLRFNPRDALQQQWVRRQLRRDVALPCHALPSSGGFVDAALQGLGWGMNPELLVRDHLAAGRLVELMPGRPLDVALHWQVVRLPVPMLDRLTNAVEQAAGAALPA